MARERPPPAPSAPEVVLSKPVITKGLDIRAFSPLPLTASQEQQVRDIYYKNVRVKCDPEIREFAHCAAGRTISVTWACRPQRLAMNKCMIGHATRDEEDRAREQWFKQIPERRKEAEEKKELQEREKQKHHEWWGLDEQGRRKQEP